MLRANCIPIFFLITFGFTGNKSFILSSISNVREQPQAASSVVCQLRIGTPITVSDKKDKWKKVKSEDCQGWMIAKLITNYKPNITGLIHTFLNVPINDLSQRKIWAERAMALDEKNIFALAAWMWVVKKEKDTVKIKAAVKAINSLYRPKGIEGLSPISQKAFEFINPLLKKFVVGKGSSARIYDELAVITKFLKSSLGKILSENLLNLQIYKSGPHKKDFNNRDLGSFAYYNHQFVDWVIEYGVMSPTNNAGSFELEPLYSHYKKTVQHFLKAYLKLEGNPELKKDCLAAYKKMIKSKTKIDYGFFSKINQYELFWLRRAMDGTSDKFKKALEKIMLFYDPEGLLNEHFSDDFPRDNKYNYDNHNAFFIDPNMESAAEGFLKFASNKIFCFSPSNNGFDIKKFSIQVSGSDYKLVNPSGKGNETCQYYVGGKFLKGNKIKPAKLDFPNCVTKVKAPQETPCKIILGSKEYRTQIVKVDQVNFEQEGFTQKFLDLIISSGEKTQYFKNVSDVNFLGDLDGDGELDAVLVRNERAEKTIYLSSVALPHELFRGVGFQEEELY